MDYSRIRIYLWLFVTECSHLVANSCLFPTVFKKRTLLARETKRVRVHKQENSLPPCPAHKGYT